MRVTILGASRFGAAIAKQLIDENHEVILIDKDHGRLEKLAERLDCGMIEGDGTMPTTLRDAFRDSSDVFIAVTNASDDNILASIVARSVGFGRVIPQITSAELMDVCHELELNDVINPHATVAESICAGLEDRTAVDQEAVLHNQLTIKRVTVPDSLAGRPLKDLGFDQCARAIAHIRGDDEAWPDPETTVQEGDGLLFTVKRDQLETLTDLFSG